MQIIAGQKRGAKLISPSGLEVRPTAQRTRESMFNILASGKLLDQLDDIICLDLFAGSGALGLEALSRGAKQSYFVENQSKAISCIKQNIRKLDYEAASKIIQADCITASQWLYEPATLVFCDPPYDKGLAIPAIMNFKNSGAMTDDALLVIETRKNEALEFGNLQLLDQRRYGMALVSFCRFA